MQNYYAAFCDCHSSVSDDHVPIFADVIGDLAQTLYNYAMSDELADDLGLGLGQ
jgi:hypothetical protein